MSKEDWSELSEAQRREVEEVVLAAYRELVLEAKTALEKAAGEQFVMLLWLELLRGFRFAGEAAKRGFEDRSLGCFAFEHEIDRYLKLGAAKLRVGYFLLRLQRNKQLAQASAAVTKSKPGEINPLQDFLAACAASESTPKPAPMDLSQAAASGEKPDDQAPGTNDQPPMTKDQGQLTKDQGQMTKDQGSGSNDQRPMTKTDDARAAHHAWGAASLSPSDPPLSASHPRGDPFRSILPRRPPLEIAQVEKRGKIES
jgi:hypothetical protein